MGWPLKARRSLFPDWLWLCDESSSHRRALHIPVQILAGKFKMEFLPTISLTKAFPVAQICPNLHKIVPSSKANPYLIIEWEGDVVGPGGIWGRVQGVGSDHWGTRSHP